ncbi:MFS transporter [candidate division KSB1 bacterium]|nr:MAG: MFS transporter [candidate division KSB1 bacterium]
MVLFAVGEAFRTGTHKALILEYLNIKGMKNQKVSYYGRTRSASQFGSAINSLIAAALVFYTGNYRYVFLATALPYVLNLFNLGTYPKELDGDLIKLNKRTFSGQIKTTLKTFLTIFKDREAMRAIFNSAGFTAFFKSTKDYLQPVIKIFAISIPLFLTMSDTRRTAVIIGIVYFIIYMLTSYASRSAEKVSQRFETLAKAINVTFWIGACFLFISGLASWISFSLLSVLFFIGLYIVHNLRKPMNVAFISDQISNKVMASGLSVESQVTTILMAILSPLLGLLADNFGIGIALAGLGTLMFAFSILVRVNKL